jgi:hypothetical protein
MNQETTNQNLQAALKYASQRLRVFPVHSVDDRICTCGKESCHSPGKHPRVKDWAAAATTDVKTIREWWDSWPNANIGIATGRDSGVFVVDVDGEEGRKSLERLKQEHGWDAKTLTARTGKGFHLYFANPGERVKNRVRLLPGIDVRGEGGYVVAPPSVHASGVTYAWF